MHIFFLYCTAPGSVEQRNRDRNKTYGININVSSDDYVPLVERQPMQEGMEDSINTQTSCAPQ